MPTPRMALTEAMRGNGLDAVPSQGSVSIALAPSWLRKLWPKGIRAMALPRHIYVDAETFAKIVAGEAKQLLRHEAVHIDQWRRHGRIGFLAKYLFDYLKGRAAGLSHSAAYRSIPFEEEARSKSE